MVFVAGTDVLRLDRWQGSDGEYHLLSLLFVSTGICMYEGTRVLLQSGCDNATKRTL